MKATLDHVGIAVRDVAEALRFYRDALGLEIEPPEEVADQSVRAHFIPVGGSTLELLEATSADSPIGRYIARRGPGLHHITLGVDDIGAAIERLKARGVRLIDGTPRKGAGGDLVAFVHPSSAHGVLVELKQAAPPQLLGGSGTHTAGGSIREATTRSDRPMALSFGDLELVSLSDGFFRLDGGAMFGVVPKPLWSRYAASDNRNRISLGLRPLIIRGVQTLLVDAGIGDKLDAKAADIYGVERAYHLDHALTDAGLEPDSIDLVLATHLHFDHCGGFTVRDSRGGLRPRFPRARYVIRRGEWEEALAANERTRASYLPENYLPLADAGVLQLIDEDETIMPGVRVCRTGGHTKHHQIVMIESQGRTAVFTADLLPTSAHLPEPWIMGYDLYPLETLNFKRTFLREAIEREYLIFFEHDPALAAGYIRQLDGRRVVERIEQ